MKITIDNLDGGGALDYTHALSTVAPLRITRTRNEAPLCAGSLDVSATSLPVPVRSARVVVTSYSGAVLFTGALATAPECVFAGVATKGAVHTLAFRAIADAADATGITPRTTHALASSDCDLHFAAFEPAMTRELARDLTLTGEVEPAAYITEYFLGDGTTAVFQLTQPPFRPAGSSTLLDERFDGAALNPRLWSVADSGSFLSLTHAGLTITGGNGLDGQTTLSSITPLELGGTLVIELGQVTLGAASDGVVGGLYSGAVERGSCFAGFNVRQSGGATLVTPFVNGAEAGSSLTMLSGHTYTLRLRLYCSEIIRQQQSYSVVADGVLHSFGGDLVSAPAALVFEARDLGTASNTAVTVLYTAQIASTPAACTFAPVNSVQLIGSIGSCAITQAGSAWITTTLPDGTQTVRVTGATGEGVDCSVTSAGRITFFSGRVPVANEQIAVSYRGRRRSITRLGTSSAAATAAWQGKVAHPPTRTTVDCENAALAALAFANARSAAATGHCVMVNPASDIVPGDVLAITSNDDTLHLVVRSVALEDGHGRPELTLYRIAFANDWATGLDAQLTAGGEADALVPTAASSASSSVLANLPSLHVVSVTSTALQIDTGTEPPPGGGFEVRRRDWAFGPGTNGDLVLRSPVRSFSIPREGQVERYFVRMYSGSSTPPVYSRFSSAVFTNLPAG